MGAQGLSTEALAAEAAPLAGRRVAAATLGCRVNQYDTDALLGQFRARGYTVVPWGSPADVYLVNTCTVTAEADRKSRQLIRRARRAAPDAVVVVAGCYAQLEPDAVARLLGAGVVLGNRDRERVVDLAEEAGRFDDTRVAVRDVFRARRLERLAWDGSRERTRAFLKIQEGCKEFCTYCIIPYARGRLRSLPLEEVRAAAERACAAGHREVVLAGIHLGAYGRDLPGRPRLADAVLALRDVPGLTRLRLSSLEPMDADVGLVEAMAAAGACPHLHLPIQSGADEVLRRMGRRYTTSEMLRLIERAREILPDLAVTTDLMVGFPGESEADWRQTLAFLEAADFKRLHVFPFSPRRGTPAAGFTGAVPREVRERRVQEAIAWSRRRSLAWHGSLVGREVEVLVEDGKPGRLEGLTPEFARVACSGPDHLRGRLVRVRVTSASPELAWGELA